MKLLGHYLKEFNRDYLSNPKDQLQTMKTVADFWATIAAIAIGALFLLAMTK